MRIAVLQFTDTDAETGAVGRQIIVSTRHAAHVLHSFGARVKRVNRVPGAREHAEKPIEDPADYPLMRVPSFYSATDVA